MKGIVFHFYEKKQMQYLIKQKKSSWVFLRKLYSSTDMFLIMYFWYY